ncbi:hypothetical protein [Bradyrhizobium sp.]|uniref:hypothetical protein n=1 Tax=Bradyrhizobium sp. TaxID=376 RepID=UPI0039E5FAE5
MNLQAIETAIRAFLQCRDGQDLVFPRPGEAEVDETWLTKFAYFGPLVSEFNDSLDAGFEQENFTLDKKIVDLRNAFAHGRLFTDFEKFPARLWKFGTKNSNGKILVEFSELLTPEWLLKNHNFAAREYGKVLRCFKRRKYKGLR